MRPDSTRDPAGLLPLTAAMFHVLVSLADQERHGYAIVKAVAARTDGAVALGTGTLYAIVKRALADGLVVESTRRPAKDDDARRRYYRLTPFGQKVMAAETARLERMVAAARSTRAIGKARS
ncbi:MAG TPA: PadR family transcriptional regulator [Vicinamibacterales bacterium]|nr:PadR family transcriptional regulator [Vicinamibacterales bacterium]